MVQENSHENDVVFPEAYSRRKLNALYRAIPLKDNTFRTLRKYFNAFANLYGIFPIKKAYRIIREQCPRLVTEEQFRAFLEVALHECEDYQLTPIYCAASKKLRNDLFEWDILELSLLFEDDLFYPTLEHQQGKPYYIPPKQELLRYADPNYCEDTPEARVLRQYLDRRLGADTFASMFLFDDIAWSCRHLTDEVIDWEILEKGGLVFKNEREADAFMKIVQDFHNNSRMQCNRGHTPLELYRANPPATRAPDLIEIGPNMRQMMRDGRLDVNEMRNMILHLDLPNEQLRLNMLQQIYDIEEERGQTADTPTPPKISRNAPCPCGSGKKYKRCCGKDKD